MEKTLCEDCNEEAKTTIEDRYFCAKCAMRILQQDTQCNGRGLGLQREPSSTMSRWSER
jgi:hypothetical protein